MESIPCDSALVMIGAIRGLSRKNQTNKFGLSTLQQWLWYKKFCCFYKLLKSPFPKYLQLSTYNISYRPRIKFSAIRLL